MDASAPVANAGSAPLVRYARRGNGATVLHHEPEMGRAASLVPRKGARFRGAARRRNVDFLQFPCKRSLAGQFPFDFGAPPMLFFWPRLRVSALKDERSPPWKGENRTMLDIAKHLHVGQTVRLDELAWGYQITVLPPEGIGQKVVAVGTDFVVLEDEIVGVKMRIPGHLIKPSAAVPEPSVPVVQAA